MQKVILIIAATLGGGLVIFLLGKNLYLGGSRQDKLNLASQGKRIYTESNCHSCHGIRGKNPIAEGYPVIAGQNKTYLVAQLKDIQNGERKNGLSAVMQRAMPQLSDEKMSAIATYLENQ